MKSQIDEENPEDHDPLMLSPLQVATKQFSPKVETIDLSFEKLGLVNKKSGQVLLEGVTGSVNHGEMCIVMGPSGCGKSTFIHTLAGRAPYGKTTGHVYINGRLENIMSYSEVIGFVPQEDVMIRSLKVKEILEHAAEVRLRLSSDERQAFIENILDMLGLSHIRYSIIGDEDVRGISGGQRKRVNVGIELVSDPTVLLLDEPTSGLDSSSSKAICDSLQQLCTLGMTVIAVLHQPRYEIFEMFHKVLLLGKGGKTIYFGPTNQVEAYFESIGFVCPPKVNPPDYFMDVISGDIAHPDVSPEKLPELWLNVADEYNAKVGFLIEDIDKDLEELDSSVSLLHLTEAKRRKKRTKKVKKGKENVVEVDLTAMRQGSNTQFLISYLVCLCGSYFALYFVFLLPRMNTHIMYGGLLGWLSSLVVIFTISLSIADATLSHTVQYFIGCLIFLALIAFLVMIRLFVKRSRIGFFGSLFLGGLGGPILLVLTGFKTFLVPREVAGIKLGFICSIIVSEAYWYPVIVRNYEIDLSSQSILFGMALWSLTAIVAVYSHYPKLANIDHSASGFWFQTWACFKRSITQQIMDWKGVAFDLGLVMVSGAFLGVIFYGLPYQGPFLSAFGLLEPCPPIIQQNFPKICFYLNFPAYDPIAPQASLSILAVSLCAVASSLRVFGSEKANFKRESASGASTEAYYFGKTLGHLPVIFVAPFLFLLPFYSMAPVVGSFGIHYIIIVMCYFSSAGIAYVVSIVIKPTSSQLVAILVILSSMTFSGANPTLTQLKENALIPKVSDTSLLFYPSYVSFIRWTQELYYLVEIEAIGPLGYQNMNVVFGYFIGDWVACWVWCVVIALAFRTFAYTALVKQEE
eukprot:TRINITY_DN5922_c0_g1_i1.p1 TRINITY_DN5922_c0_g1~~TRINITY_DN5922_c0_g1_i1.p1  ORF type:complete len:966 (-),score=184.84 TRINITY_DN5922_c0_g1_i1:909-3488(-)